MLKNIKILLLICIFLAPPFIIFPYKGFLFVESDLDVQVKFPRAWKKNVYRQVSALRIILKKKREAQIILTAFKRSKSDLSREIEGRLDRLNSKYGNINVIFEKKYPDQKKKYSEKKLLLLEYEKNGTPYLELLLCANADESFHAISGITPKNKFEFYKTQFFMTFKTLSLSRKKWNKLGRNDSKRYISDIYKDYEKEEFVEPTLKKEEPLIVAPKEPPKSELEQMKDESKKGTSLPTSLDPLPQPQLIFPQPKIESQKPSFDVTDDQFFPTTE
jgi:hypothetical protein